MQIGICQHGQYTQYGVYVYRARIVLFCWVFLLLFLFFRLFRFLYIYSDVSTLSNIKSCSLLPCTPRAHIVVIIIVVVVVVIHPNVKLGCFNDNDDDHQYYVPIEVKYTTGFSMDDIDASMLNIYLISVDRIVLYANRSHIMYSKCVCCLCAWYTTKITPILPIAWYGAFAMEKKSVHKNVEE